MGVVGGSAPHLPPTDRPPPYAPTAGVPLSNVSAVVGPPSIQADKHGWFNYFDTDRSGYLDLEELVQALATTFGKSRPDEVASLRETVGAIWCAFDFDMNGEISMAEFTARDGLCDTVIANLNHRQNSGR